MAESKKYSLHLLESQIIKMTVVEDVEFKLQDATETIAEAVILGKGKPYGILFDANMIGNMTHEARDEFAKSPLRIAVAIVTDNLAAKIIGNFFIKFHKPWSASRIFKEEQPALEWLRDKIVNESSTPKAQPAKSVMLNL